MIMIDNDCIAQKKKKLRPGRKAAATFFLRHEPLNHSVVHEAHGFNPPTKHHGFAGRCSRLHL